MPREEATTIASSMAETLKDTGFNLNFAPVLDVAVNPDNPIIALRERSFSADPKTVAKYGSIFAKAYVSQKIQCAYKHFPGHGSSTTDSHLGFVDVTDTWHDQELLPFTMSLSKKTHCGMIMTAHIVNRKLDPSGLPATLSHPILTDLLRHDLGFDGVIITDDMQMKAISAHYGLENSVTLAINAGADMLIFGNQMVDVPQNPSEIINLIEQKVASGEISEDRINEAYQHIQHFKMSLM
jgi:beta-N-acetylhexosaminidase